VTEIDPIQLIEQDQALKAREIVKDLPADDPVRVQIETLTEHIASPEAHQEYYKTMRGGVCPENEVFRRHEQVTRFAKIRALILERKHQMVLDLGCLDGWQLLNLAASGVKGIGVDLCGEAIGVALDRAKKWGFEVNFIESAIEDVNICGGPPGMSIDDINEDTPVTQILFDAAIMSEVLEHVLDPLACFQTAAKHLKPSGILYVSVPATAIPHRGKLEDAREHLRVFSEQDIIDLAAQAGLHRVVDHEIIEQQDEGQRFANRTISFRRATITVYTGHVTGGWNPSDPMTLGGSEELVVKTAEAWATQGHIVTVHGDVQTGAVNSVQYYSRVQTPAANPDVLICYKTLDYIDYPAGSTIFWTTDLPAPGQAATFFPPKLVEPVKAIICISNYHRQELLKAVPWLNPAKVHQHWLGIDREEIDCAVQSFEKVPHRVLYASSYDRGLRQLLEAWPTVKAAVPDAELHVTYGWDFWIKSEAVVAKPIAESMRQERKALDVLLAQPGVTHLGRLTREGTLREFAQAEVWAYPCTGGELCCKTALEVQAMSCKVLVVPTMVLAETAEHGRHTTFERFADDLIDVLRDTSTPTYPCPPSWDDLARWSWNVMKPGVSAPQQSNIEPVEPPDAPLERFSIPSCTSEPPTRQLSILMAVGGMPFDGETDRKRDLGGSESAAIALSRAMAKRGHSVTVFSNLPDKPGKFDGVSYLPIDQYARYAASTPHDVSIVQREPSAFNMAFQSKLNVLWCHDLGLKRYHVPFRSSLWNVDYVVPVSHWHGRQLCEVYDLPAELIVPMNNGIEYNLIRKTVDKKTKRDPNALVYASRPERGLDVLLQSVFPKLLERNPNLVLYVAGYANTTSEMEGFYRHCHQLMEKFGDHVKYLGALTKAELYKLYSRASAYVYVSRNFREVSCISLLESAASGLPVIATTLGALPETASRIDGATRLVEHPGHEATPEFINRFVNEAWDVLSNPTTLMAMSIKGATEAASCSWDVIAEEWENFLLGAIELRSKDMLRLARHQWRLGDIRGVNRVLPALTPDEYTAFRHGAEIAVMDADKPPMPPQSVINALCNVADSLKPKTILGLGPHGAEVAQAVAQAIGANHIDEGPADLVIGVETLDCASDPSAHIAEAQTLVKTDGHVCFVTASPGVQQDRLHNGQKRAKRWVFDNHDLKELFKDRLDLLAMVIEGGLLSAYDGRPLAWQLHCFQRSDAKIGQINTARRLWLQSPQLSLTGAMIVKDGEGLLTRCLKSIAPYCDELVIEDTGSTDTTPDILLRFGVEPGKGLNPLDVGFDAARNKGLERATGDVILWVDDDEELLDAKALPKYLRWSMYNGCAIQQHHFSAVPPNAFKPDLPVRLFRRTWLNGKNTGIRFIGRVHEHPESGMNQSVGQSIVLSDVHIAHDGYLTESTRRGRFDRNIALMLRDRAAYPDRVLGKFLMLRDWIHLARYDSEQNGGALTPSAVQYLEAAIEGYRRDFLGGMHQMAVDGLPYYNEALQILRRGFEVQIVLRIGGIDGQPRELTYSGRVLNEEDLQKMLSNSARELSAVWQGEYL